ncbi:MAG: methylglyoxal synthase [Actinomycetales bacterium]|nr:methylglyoxal synthase [Actinomycetales bacterium]
MKPELADWAEGQRHRLAEHCLFATGSTGRLLRQRLGLPIHRFLGGPVGGDQQIGAYIAQGMIDVLVYFWDPLAAQPHEADGRALLRVATVWNVAVAGNRTSADMIITSPLFLGDYVAQPPIFERR